jgi:hypothetical protein
MLSRTELAKLIAVVLELDPAQEPEDRPVSSTATPAKARLVRYSAGKNRPPGRVRKPRWGTRPGRTPRGRAVEYAHLTEFGIHESDGAPGEKESRPKHEPPGYQACTMAR